MRLSKPWLTVFVALAFVVLLPAPEARASEEHPHCFACENCNPELSCLGCGVLTLNAISGCCGMGGGVAYCMAEWGGFGVVCDGGATACQCDMIGGNCGPMLMAGG
jgi:hypothetical protein